LCIQKSFRKERGRKRHPQLSVWWSGSVTAWSMFLEKLEEGEEEKEETPPAVSVVVRLRNCLVCVYIKASEKRGGGRDTPSCQCGGQAP